MSVAPSPDEVRRRRQTRRGRGKRRHEVRTALAEPDARGAGKRRDRPRHNSQDRINKQSTEDDSHTARAEATAAKSQLQTANRALQRAEQRLLVAERRSAKLLERIQASDAKFKRARMTRDRAERLLRQKLATVKDAQHLRDDPDALLAVIAEQRHLLAWYRARLAAVERALRALGGSPPSRGNP